MESFENYEENEQSAQEPVAQVQTFAVEPAIVAPQPVAEKPKKKGKFWKGLLALVLAGKK